MSKPIPVWKLLAALLVLPLLGFVPTAQAEEDDKPAAPTRVNSPTDVAGPAVNPPTIADDQEQPNDGPSQQGAGSGSTSSEADDPDDEEGNGSDRGEASNDRPPPPPPPSPADLVPPGDRNFDTPDSQDREQIRTPPPSTLVNIDFKDTDLKDVVKHFAELTGRNFIIDNNVKGNLTIISPKQVTVGEAYEAFLSALQVAGFTTVTVGKLTKIVPSQSGISNPLRIYDGDYVPYTDNFVTRMLKLDNVAASEVSRVIQPMISKGANLTAYEPSNTLILTDSAANIRRIERIISELDLAAPTQQLEIIQIKHADSGQLLEKIRAIYGDEGTTSSRPQQPVQRNTRTSRRSSRGRNQPQPEATSTSNTVGAAHMISKMIADERTNAIIVLATQSALDDIKDLIARLDYDVELRSDLNVVYLRHAKAEDLVQVLTQVVQQTNQRGNTNTAARRTQAGTTARSRRTQTAQAAPAAQANRALGGEFSENVRITADAATNSLVITASTEDFRRLKHVIQMLDIERRQVFVETVIMEISDERNTSMGVSWNQGGLIGPEAGTTQIAGWEFGTISGLAADPTALAGLALGILGRSIEVALPGSDLALPIPAFGIILQAVQQDTSANVLSAPNILTLDNQEAEIVVGETVPFVSSQSRDNNNQPILSITREDVALTLRVTPQISEGRTVTLEIEQEISEVKGDPGVDILTSIGPTTTRRSANTTVAVQDNQTIVIGGLMQNKESLTERKVPILGDIPLLGALFRNRSKSYRKTNLLIFLTPHIITGPEDLEEVYRVKMAQRTEFLRRFYGKSVEERDEALRDLIQYSMNVAGEPSVYRNKRFPNVQDDSGAGPGRPAQSVTPVEEELLEEGDTLIRPDGTEEVIDDGTLDELPPPPETAPQDDEGEDGSDEEIDEDPFDDLESEEDPP
jgi:general secretion pathway protein D